MAAFSNPDISLIMPAGGGKGANQLLPLLDFDTIAANPKIFCGLSDPSIIANAITARSRLATLHGPTGYDFSRQEVNPYTEDNFWRILGTIRSLLGTPYMPSLEGAILILEEVFVPWVQVDVALTHLRLAGVFDQIAALIIGTPVDTPRDDAPDDDWDRLILRSTGATCPVITNADFGHTERKFPLPLGLTVELDLTAATPALRYTEDLVTTA
jgi:muramoyltetrapeptide carboxypeptidase